jgi:FkbM family methyltransferase
MTLHIGGRDLKTIGAAMFQRQHYVAGVNMLRNYRHPLEMYGRYLLGIGSYPAEIDVETPSGRIGLTVYSRDDVLTVNEIFCRTDYIAKGSDRVFVDFGSNIGISAAYFLSRGDQGFVHLFEPLPQNIERLKRNLRAYAGRYCLTEAAVGTANGTVAFGWEPTGRYGGIGKDTERQLSVPCLDSNEVLASIIARHGAVDVLKIDVETLERQLTERLPRETSQRIDRIYVEHNFAANPLEATHTYTQYGSVARFVRCQLPVV